MRTFSKGSMLALFALCATSVAVILSARLAIGPADLYEKDQPKTLAYVADVLVHGRYALPRDVLYQPATKPPLYNWLAAGAIKAGGSWSELAMKSPSVLGAIGVALVLAALSWRGSTSVASLAVAIWFTFGVEPRHGSTLRLLFLARPDMLQALFLTGAWAAATLAMRVPRMRALVRADGDDEGADERTHPWHPAVFWACVSGAMLTKGPLALLVIVYAFVASRLIAGEWRAVRRLRPIAGSLAAIAVVGTWLFVAHRIDPDHVRHVMLGAEIVGRVSSQAPEGIAKPFWFTAMLFVTKGGPFALLALVAAAAALVHRRWLRPPDAISLGAALWLAALLVGLSVPAGKRIDYLLPTFPPAAYLAARLLVSICRRAPISVAWAGLLPLAAALWLARAHLTTFHESRESWSDRAAAFAADVRARVPDDAPLLVLVRGKHPLVTLLRRHQGGALDAGQLRAARWVVLPLVDTDASPIAVSELVPLGFEVDNRAQGVLGLFDMRRPDAPTLDELIEAARAAATWTKADNPYRSPHTAWRDEGS